MFPRLNTACFPSAPKLMTMLFWCFWSFITLPMSSVWYVDPVKLRLNSIMCCSVGFNVYWQRSGTPHFRPMTLVVSTWLFFSVTGNVWRRCREGCLIHLSKPNQPLVNVHGFSWAYSIVSNDFIVSSSSNVERQKKIGSAPLQMPYRTRLYADGYNQ